MIERLGYIVVELLTIGRCVHADNGPVEERGVLCYLPFEEIKVGHRFGIIVFYGVCVDHKKLYPACNKRVIIVSEHLSEHLIARAEAVMIALHHDVRIAETLQFLPCPGVFLRRSEVSNVAQMNHKVDGIPPIYVIYLREEVLIPLV